MEQRVARSCDVGRARMFVVRIFAQVRICGAHFCAASRMGGVLRSARWMSALRRVSAEVRSDAHGGEVRW